MFLVRVFPDLLLSDLNRSASLLDDTSRRFSLQTGNVQNTFGDNYGNPPDHAAALELVQAGKIRVQEMTTHRLGLAETGHFCLSLRGAAGDVAISPGLRTR